MREWKLADAKNKLSEVVEDAMTKGPQIVTRSGRRVVAVVDYEEFRRRPPAQRRSLASHLLAIPAADSDEPDFERLPMRARKVGL